VATVPGPGRCSPRRGRSWRTIPTPASFRSFWSVRNGGFARRPRDGQLDGELTGRELDGELSTRQMAESLYVAPSTVRTQIKSIYRKLGVSSRGAAVEEARVKGLL